MTNWAYVYAGYLLTGATVLTYVYSLKRKARRLTRRVEDIVHSNGRR